MLSGRGRVKIEKTISNETVCACPSPASSPHGDIGPPVVNAEFPVDACRVVMHCEEPVDRLGDVSLRLVGQGQLGRAYQDSCRTPLTGQLHQQERRYLQKDQTTVGATIPGRDDTGCRGSPSIDEPVSIAII